MPSWDKRKSQKNGGGNGYVAGAVIAAAGLAAALVWAGIRAQEHASLDPDTLCPKSGPVSTVSVLIDRTDGLSEVQGAALEKRLLLWAREVPRHGALRVYEVGKGGTLLEPLVSVCNPGDGSDKSVIDANPKMLRASYEAKFAEPVRLMIEAMQLDEEAPSSPILEAVQAIAVRDFGPGAPEGRKELVIVSDLLQHGPDLSLYRGVPELEAFRQSAYGRGVAADLSDVHVSLHLLNRGEAAAKQTDALGQFWIRWLEEQGAIVEEFRIVPGMR